MKNLIIFIALIALTGCFAPQRIQSEGAYGGEFKSVYDKDHNTAYAKQKRKQLDREMAGGYDSAPAYQQSSGLITVIRNGHTQFVPYFNSGTGIVDIVNSNGGFTTIIMD